MREIRSSGSVRGASGDGRPYRERSAEAPLRYRMLPVLPPKRSSSGMRIIAVPTRSAVAATSARCRARSRSGRRALPARRAGGSVAGGITRRPFGRTSGTGVQALC
jgi:hypothetical protein